MKKPNMRTTSTRTSKASGLYQGLRTEKTRADVANHKLSRIKSMLAQGTWSHTNLCLTYQHETETTECICRCLTHNLWLDNLARVLEGVD